MTFCYYTRPLQGQQSYTGQPKYRGTIRSAESVEEIAQRSGMTAEQVEEVLRHTGQYVVEKTIACWRLEPLAGWLGFAATCGGSQPTSDFYPSYKNLAMEIRLRLSKAADFHAKQIFSAENVGHNGLAAPQIVRVTNKFTNLPNSYTPGKIIQIELKDGKGTLDPAVSTQGVFFRANNGTLVRCDNYGYTRGSLIVAGVPMGLTGPQQLVVTMDIYGNDRTGIYDQMLTLSTSTEEAAPAPAPRSRASRRNGKGTSKDLALPN